MSKMLKKTILATSIFATAACSSGVKDKIGFRNNAPDEFKVVTNAPLTLPPDFTLRPPMPGAKRPQEVDVQQKAKDALFEGKNKNTEVSTSKGEDALWQKANVSAADPHIKATLTQDEQSAKAAKEAKKERGFFAKIAAFFGFGGDASGKQPTADAPPGNNNAGAAQKDSKQAGDNGVAAQKESKQAGDNGVAAAKDGKGGLLNNLFGVLIRGWSSRRGAVGNLEVRCVKKPFSALHPKPATHIIYASNNRHYNGLGGERHFFKKALLCPARKLFRYNL